MADAAPDQQLLDTLRARAAGEADFVVSVAGIRKVNWGDALRLYHQCFTEAAKTLLARADAAQARRKAHGR